jgi:ribosomal protein S18 acetylase RimI-like enzyme
MNADDPADAVAAVLPGQQTLLACWDALTRISPGARIVAVEGAIAAVFPSWAPLNNAILLRCDGEVAEVVAAEQLRVLYQDAGVPVWALWRPTRIRDLDTDDAAGALGELKRDTTTLVMQTTLRQGLRRYDAVVPASIDAVARFDDDVDLSADDLGEPEGVPGLAGWALLDGGLVVSTAWSYEHDGDCGVFGVGTLPQFRRRGFARLLMEHILASAQARGAATASLQSTRMGQPLYESLGFMPAGRYEEWIWQ